MSSTRSPNGIATREFEKRAGRVLIDDRCGGVKTYMRKGPNYEYLN